MHINTKHFYIVYFVTLEIYYFTGKGYRNDNSNKMYLFILFYENRCKT